MTGPWTAGARDAMLRHGADRLVLNYARGFSERHLEFLDGMHDRVRELEVLTRTLKDITPIYSLGSTLEGLSIQTGADRLDLALLPRLKWLAVDWGDVDTTIEGATRLEELILLDYGGTDLEALGVKPVLTELVLKPARRLESLRGVESLPSLTSLQVKLAPRLHDMTAVEPLGARLRELEFEACRGLSSLDSVARLTGLTFLGASDCGDIESLAPLANLTELEVLHIWGDTKITNNDLSPLAALPHLRELRIQDRRSYRPRAAAIERPLTGR